MSTLPIRLVEIWSWSMILWHALSHTWPSWHSAKTADPANHAEPLLSALGHVMMMMSEHTVPYHTITHDNIILYHTLPYHTYHTIHTIPYRSIPYRIIPYHTILYYTIPRLVSLPSPLVRERLNPSADMFLKYTASFFATFSLINPAIDLLMMMMMMMMLCT